jgi:hypothetical protein
VGARSAAISDELGYANWQSGYFDELSHQRSHALSLALVPELRIKLGRCGAPMMTKKSGLLGLGLSLAALATAACPSTTAYGWLLANRRDHPLELTVRRTEQCSNGGNLSDVTAFGPPERVRVRAQDEIPLTPNPFANGAYLGCGAIWISVEHEFDLVLAWGGQPLRDENDDSTPYSVIVEGPKDALVLYVPDAIEQLPPPGAKLLWLP